MTRKTPKDYLIDEYAERYQMTKVEAREELDRFPDFVAWALKEHGEINFNGYFKFQSYEVPERKWKGFDGEDKISPKKIKVNCKIGTFLKQWMNGDDD